MGELRHRGSRRGVCNPLQPAHSPALSGGLGGQGLDQDAHQGSQESFRNPRKRFRVPFSTLEALLSTHLSSSESSTSLGSNKVDRKVEGQDFFSGSAAVAAGHLVSADPVEACGVVEKESS